jgi:hypothetical protein
MLRSLFLLIPPLLLQACQSTEPDAAEGGDEAANSTPQIRMITEARVEATNPQMNVQLIADTLFEALQALDADRLLTPIDDNAHARFMRVLAYDRDNAIALQGLQDIVARYLELSMEASRRGLFEEAQQMVDRAIFVDGNHLGIAPTLAALQAEMNSGDLFFELDAGEFSRRSAAAEATLVDIAQQARQQDAFFLITAPNDDLARWMFSIMRGAVEGYRLRGNIELASRTTVRLRLPDADPMGC